MKSKKIILPFILIISSAVITATVVSSTSIYSSFNNSKNPEVAEADDFGEWACVDIGPNGDIWSEYHFHGPAVQLSGVNLDMIQDLFPEQYNRFSWANWEFSFSSNPDDINVRIELNFNTNDPDLARSDAEWIMGFVNAFSITDYYEEQLNSWVDSDWWTSIVYAGHVNWPNLLSVYNESIPREYGGLAETIDIMDCNRLRFWLNKNYNGISKSMGFEWWDMEVENLNGGHSFNFKDYLPVTKLQTVFGLADTTLNFRLPKVTNLVRDPISAVVNYYSEKEPWDFHHWYDVSLSIPSGIVDHFTVSFDYDFIPWDMVPREEASLQVNPYGYAYKNIRIQHELANIINWTDHFPGILLDSWMDINPDWDSQVGMEFRLKNLTGDNHESDVLTFSNWLESNMVGGWFQTENSSWSEQWWNGTGDEDSWKWNLNFNFTTLDRSNWDSLWNTTWLYNNSNMMQNSDLKNSYHYYGSTRYNPRKGGYFTHDSNFDWNPLNRFETTLVKEFLPENNPSHSFSMIDLFGWSTFTKSEEFISASLRFEIPVNDIESFNITNPEFSWGYAFSHWWWFNYNWGETYISSSIEVYDSNPYYEKDYVNYPVDDFECEFDYDFYTDSVDIIIPGGSLINENPYSSDAAFIKFNAWDNYRMGWWDEGYLNGSSHFLTTGISSVEYDLFFSALTIDHPDFHWNGTMTDYGSFWGFTRNTTPLADGWYTMRSKVTDGASNVGYEYSNIEIDNYDGSFVIAPTTNITSHNFTDGSKLKGNETLTFNITDDIDVFAAIITIDGTGWVLEEESNPNQDLYDFNWTTKMYSEGIHFVTVTAWDMDGHETTETYEVEIENYPEGDPPFVEIVDPAIPGMILENMYTFRANVTDDVEISSVQAKIDERVPQQMVYNSTTGLYEFEYDVSTLYNGTHTFSVIVFDMDKNQHQVTRSIEFIANTTHNEDINTPPEVRNVIPGNFSDASDILDGNVEISLETRDDLGIEAVSIEISTITGVDPSNYPTDPDTIEYSDLRIVSSYPHNMIEGTASGDWTVYKDNFDSTQGTDGLYLIEIIIGDIDPFSHTISVKFLIIIHNEMNDPFGQIPGFRFEFLIGCLGFSIFVGYIIVKKKYPDRLD